MPKRPALCRNVSFVPKARDKFLAVNVSNFFPAASAFPFFKINAREKTGMISST